MLSFAVFDESGPARQWPLRQAYLFGPGEVPVQSVISFKDGIIRCERPTAEAAGLSLQFQVDAPPADEPDAAPRPAPAAPGGPLGLFALRTCLLPVHPEPYLLSVELARHRIMLVLNKLEQWGLFDLLADHPVMRRFERARGLFTEAVVAQGRHRSDGHADSMEADLLARQSLALAVDAGEQLTLLDAERQIKERALGRLYHRAVSAATEAVEGARIIPGGPAKNPDGVGVTLPAPAAVGCTINPATFTDDLARLAQTSCDFLSIPTRWIDMEPGEGKYAWARTDKWIEWAVRQGKLPIVAGPIVDFRENAVPEWLYIWEHDYETMRELVYEHVKQVVTRYRRTVSRWTVASGLHVNDNIGFTLEQMMDLTRIAALLVKKLHPTARIQVEITQPWGEYFADNRRSMPPTVYADLVSQAGIVVDAYALRLQMGQPAPGRVTRDMMVLSDILDRYAELDKPLAITAVGAPSGPIPQPQPVPGSEEPPPAPIDPGFWRAPWSPVVQAEWLAQVVAICAAKPFVHSVCWQDFYDGPPSWDMPLGGLITENGQFKPACKRFTEVRQAIKEGRAPWQPAPPAARPAASTTPASPPPRVIPNEPRKP